MYLKQTVLGAALLGLTMSANATIISGGGLQAGLDNLTVGSNFLNVNTQQYNPDEVWQISASGVSVHVLLFEFAGFEGTNRFGIYDINDTSNRLEIFDGAACGTADTTCSGSGLEIVLNGGSTTYTNLISGGSSTFSGNQFGYYLDSSAQNGGGFFYSQEDLNSDVADAAHEGTTDHLVAYAGDGGLYMDIYGTGYASPFSAGEFILAWEDLLFPNSDYDYSDMVILVESVVPVSAPATVMLLGIGLLGLLSTRRRQTLAA